MMHQILGSFENAFQLEAAIQPGPVAFIGLGSGLLGLVEKVAYRPACAQATDNDKAPRLHEADRRCVVGGAEQPQ